MAKLKCPNCKGVNHNVYSTRQYSDRINRYRECKDCKKRFTTIERVQSAWSYENAIKQIKKIVDRF
jgi:transcriptional regulator NrdR family protein